MLLRHSKERLARLLSLTSVLLITIGLLACTETVPIPNNTPERQATLVPPPTPMANAISIPFFPAHIAAYGDGVWITDAREPRLHHLSRDGDYLGSIELDNVPRNLTASDENVWVFDPVASKLLNYSHAGELVWERNNANQVDLEFSSGHLWISNGIQTISILNPEATELRNVDVGGRARMIAPHQDGVVVAVKGRSEIAVISGSGQLSDRIPTSGLPSPSYAGAGVDDAGPDAVVSTGSSIWAGFAGEGLVVRHGLDHLQTAVVGVDVPPSLIEVGADDVWVTSSGTAEITRIDAATLERTSFSIEFGAQDIAWIDGRLWVTQSATRQIAVLEP
jgi:hypothetical protein